jgi:hypothetical protein
MVRIQELRWRMPTVRKRFITPLQKTGKGISRRPTTVAAITVCNQQLSTSAQVINPERCPIQTDSEIAEYYCKCEPGAVYNVAASRKGVVIGGTSGLWFETPGQVIIVGGTVFFLYVDSVGGVMLGGSAERGPDITNLQATGGAVVNGFVEISTARPGGFNYEIDARGGVVCSGSARRGPDITNISTSGGAVVNGWTEVSMHTFQEGGDNLTIYEVTECAQGVVCGGTADVSNESWQMLFYYQLCEETPQGDWTAIYLPPGNYADSGDPYYDDHIRVNQSYTCGNDGFNGLTFYTELVRRLVDIDGNATQVFGLPDELEALDLTLDFVDYVSGEEGDLPVIASDVGFINFDIGQAITWVGDTFKIVTITATIEGVEYQWTAKHDLPQCPNIVLLEPYTSDSSPPCNLIMEYVTDATYDAPRYSH